MNLLRPLRMPDGGVDAVYFSHVLEHLHLDEGHRLLRECFRILRPGGAVRVVVPDTEAYVENYRRARAAHNAEACIELNRRLWFRPLAGNRGLLRRMYGAATDFHSHKFMYDRPFLTLCLQQAGFVDVRVADYDSNIPEIGDVELPDRVGDGAGFAVEGTRPLTA